LLIEFAEALLANAPGRLRSAREAVAQAVGEAGLVDAAAVAANFNSIDRVADSTGVPLEDEKANLTEDFRDTLGINAFQVGRNE
jgi:hypothetical protein